MLAQSAERRALSNYAFETWRKPVNASRIETEKDKAPPRILIVDDDASQRSLLDSFLAGQGFDTLPVESGEEALKVLQREEVNMMISDVRMPGISGLET